ncbi:hypothetical protein [Aureliella helgolandensis]|uniref:Uncharacterized protein n=1 Tax=Aureliella helgolandensis TaxID=2527968 RepID=A0A518GBJ5_9BACT|nr:hypothetical protein [Aureliella helgolandensis]QDV25869.1 hypothetical protein Q31a_41970 [Aureliella helgolandensis]QDV25933.1 hypothetical protein Q31a_43010 [Aureliella helgolandensis]
MTKNSAIGQSVIWTGCLLSGLGLYLDRLGLLFALGGTLFSFGMIQSYFGSVFEIQTSKRLPYLLLGVPLTLSLFYCAFLSLREFSAAYVIVSIVVFALALQTIISLLMTKFWDRRNKPKNLSASGSAATDRR